MKQKRDFRRTKRHRWKCGLHSKIPVCCVLFYIFIWCPIILESRKNWPGLYHWYWNWMGTWDCDSSCIRCPLCFIFYRRQVKPIRCHCYDHVIRGVLHETIPQASA